MALGLSQVSLAKKLGLTFQQIQKYESGSNRISASKLYRTACVLSCPVQFFFEGLSNPVPEQPSPQNRRAELILSAFLSRHEGMELAADFTRIRDGRIRQQIVRLVRYIAQSDGPTNDEAPDPQM